MAHADAHEPCLVYFSSVTNNTHRFVEKLGFDSYRLPLRRSDPQVHVQRPYVLVVPTYGGGSVKGAVPKQVIRYLNQADQRQLCVGVISSGNTNFGEAYALAGNILAQKLKVPFLFRFELLGTPQDVEKTREGLVKFWQNI